MGKLRIRHIRHIRVSYSLKAEKTTKNLTKELFDLDDNDPDTIVKVFQHGKKLAGENGNLCGTPILDDNGNVRSYSWKTYGQMEAMAKKCAMFLQKEGLKPETDIVGIFAKNCTEYFAAIIACCYRNLPNCSLYDTLGKVGF